MFRKTLRLALVGATVSASAVLLSSTNALAAPEGTVTLTVNSGTAATAFGMTLPAGPTQGASCSGGGAANYRWDSYIISASIDVTTLQFSDGPAPIAPATLPAGTFVSTLTSTLGDLVKQNSPAPTPVGLISGIPQFNFTSLVGSGITAGVYKIGIVCANFNTPGVAGRVDNVTRPEGHYWEKTITITNATTMAWSAGAVPPAPVLGALTPGNGSLTGSFTAAAADPVATYALSGVPALPGQPITVTPGTPFTVSGLTNGTSYALTVRATNTVGFTDSNTVNGTPAPGVIAAPVLTATSAVGQVSLSWTTPPVTPGATLASYTVTATAGVVAGSPFTVAAGTNTLLVTGLAPGAYSFTVQAIYNAPFVGAVSNVATASSNNAQTLIQDITVVRPVGALVLTQRCGVYGSAAAYSDNVFGSLPALPATPLSADPDPVNGPTGASIGTAPTTGAAPGGPADPSFSEYPYPVDDLTLIPNATYPTHCGIDLGIGRLITSGPRAGQYFAANGRMAQITVVNTQDVDSGWTLNGRMSAFTTTAGAGDSFHGNHLGWDPEVSYDSAANLDGYDMAVLAGGVRQPVAGTSTTGLGAASNETNTTLAQSLAKSAAGVSLGLAVIDARLRLLIPVTANAGTYTGTLTFTTV
jgi:hypothetical protein